MSHVDINCDMGEGMPNDAELMPFISSANIACGYHAGDADMMHRTVQMAIDHGVAVGAHPSYPDRVNFGRLAMCLSPEEVYTITLEQIGLLMAVCDRHCVGMQHVKPHGALYNSAAADEALASAIAQAVKEAGAGLTLFGPPQSALTKAAAALGIPFRGEAFADRSYQPDGLLTPRSAPGALITDENKVIQQVLEIAERQRVAAVNGQFIPMPATTICIHGDGPTAVTLARAIHEAINNINKHAAF